MGGTGWWKESKGASGHQAAPSAIGAPGAGSARAGPSQALCLSARFDRASLRRVPAKRGQEDACVVRNRGPSRAALACRLAASPVGASGGRRVAAAGDAPDEELHDGALAGLVRRDDDPDACLLRCFRRRLPDAGRGDPQRRLGTHRRDPSPAGDGRRGRRVRTERERRGKGEGSGESKRVGWRCRDLAPRARSPPFPPVAPITPLQGERSLRRAHAPPFSPSPSAVRTHFAAEGLARTTASASEARRMSRASSTTCGKVP